MHEWTVYACKSFTTAWEYWQSQVPLIAIDFRFVTDAILSLAALHAAKSPPSIWIPTAGRMVPIHELANLERDTSRIIPGHWDLGSEATASYYRVIYERSTQLAQTAASDTKDMLTVSRIYSDRAIEGHRKALQELTADNIEAVYVTSVLVGYIALTNLGDDSDDSNGPTMNPALWLQLGAATRKICMRWRDLIGPGWIAFSGVFYGSPDMSDEKELFNPEHSETFIQLLTWGREFEHMSTEDAEAYQQALSYIGLIYKGIVDGSDPPAATCRRLTAMPSRLSPRFTELVAQNQPRAIAMLAHVFACMKLLEEKTVWFKDIAEGQVRKIVRQLPPAWVPVVQWPVAVAEGRIRLEDAKG